MGWGFTKHRGAKPHDGGANKEKRHKNPTKHPQKPPKSIDERAKNIDKQPKNIDIKTQKYLQKSKKSRIFVLAKDKKPTIMTTTTTTPKRTKRTSRTKDLYILENRDTNLCIAQSDQYDETNALTWAARKLAELKKSDPTLRAADLYLVGLRGCLHHIQGFKRAS